MQKISSYNCNFPTLNRAQHYAFVHYYNSETPTHTLAHTLTWAAVGGQVAVAVSVAASAAVDGAVILIGAAVRPCVCKPRLGSWFTYIQQTWPGHRHNVVYYQC